MNQLMRIGDLVRTSRVTAFDVMPPKFKATFDSMNPEILELVESELESQFRRTMVDFMLRQRLWELVPLAVQEDRKLTVEEWAKGICDPPYIHQKLMTTHFRLAWIFTPLQTGYDRYSEMFDILMTKIRKKVVEMNINDDNVGDAVRLLENITNRVMGPVPKNINLRAQQISSPPPPAVTGPQDLDEKIAELEKQKLSQAKLVSPPETPE